MSWGKERIAQLQLPNPEDDDPHPRLLFEGEGVHAVQGFPALFPHRWHDIIQELTSEPEGPGCWYIFPLTVKGVCPIGLFVKV